MSTLRINNIEAKSVPASPTLDEKVKITNSTGDVLVHVDGKTSGITTIGINTTASNITFDANSNVKLTGIVTATTLAVNDASSATSGSRISVGISEDIKIYHIGGADSYIRNSTGDFFLQGNNSGTPVNNIKFENSTGATEIYYNSGKKLETTNDGVNITGNLGVGNTTTVGRNAGVSTATGALIYNTTTNALEVYNGSSWLSVTSKVGSFNISYLVVGGGGAGGGNYRGGGGGAGALRTNWNNETQGGGTSSGAVKAINIGTSYAIGVGTAGVGRGGSYGWSGATSTFDDIVSKGGGGGGRYNTTNGTEDGRPSADPGGGSGGGGGGGQASSSTGQGGASGTYGYNGGNGSPTGGAQCGGGGGGAGAAGVLGGGGGTSGDGGTKVSNTITGSSVDYAGGGGGGNYENGNTTIGGGAGAGNGGRGTGTAGQAASIANRGSGGGGAGGAGGGVGGAGSAGVVILRFPSTYTATLSGGVSSSSTTVGTDTVLTITATSSSSETVTFS